MKTIVALLIASLSSITVFGDDPAPKDLADAYLQTLSSIERDLIEAAEKIAAKHGVPVAKVEEVSRKMLLDSDCIFVKGGVAVIRAPVYVLPNTQKNEAIASGEDVTGGDAAVPELLVFSKERFVGRLSIPADGADDLILAFYTPERIRFFDWKELLGGYYVRKPEKPEPNKPLHGTPAKAPSSSTEPESRRP